jgi:uncharacterized protein
MDKLNRLIELARPFYETDDQAHDFAHIKRVMQTAKKIGLQEGAKLDILLPGVLLHDIVNLPKNHPDRPRASQMAADKAQSLLEQAQYSEDQIKQIQIVIKEHSYSAGHKASTIESAVMQDADRIDALGAIGLMRWCTVGGKLGARYYDEVDPLAQNRDLDDRAYSLDHFEVKLFKLAELMNTKTAKIMATSRIGFMKSFKEQLLSEIRGE